MLQYSNWDFTINVWRELAFRSFMQRCQNRRLSSIIRPSTLKIPIFPWTLIFGSSWLKFSSFCFTLSSFCCRTLLCEQMWNAFFYMFYNRGRHSCFGTQQVFTLPCIIRCVAQKRSIGTEFFSFNISYLFGRLIFTIGSCHNILCPLVLPASCNPAGNSTIAECTFSGCNKLVLLFASQKWGDQMHPRPST